DEEEVIIFNENEIKIKKSFLIEYIHKKGLVFAQFFDYRRFSQKTLAELKIIPTHNKQSGPHFVYSLYIDSLDLPSDDLKSCAGVLGKKVIEVPDSFKTTIFSNEKEYEEFSIRVDENGKDIAFTCNKDYLDNYFGKNKGSPHYLTPVFFKKEVLDKYYSNPEKFSISDGILYCQDLWNLRMDNDHKDIVMVYLGDLGHLTTKEQKHWKQFNVIDGKISHANFKRSFEAEPCNPNIADLVLKQKFAVFRDKWFKKYGWYLFLPLHEEDAHYYKSLRIPTKNSQQEFDQLVLAVTKIIIDSINEKKLKEGLISENSDDHLKKTIREDSVIKKDDKSIELFRKYLAQKHRLQFPDMISFMKNLQDLRSSSAAHRKGTTYEKIKKRFNLSNNFKDVFEKILLDCVKILDALSEEKTGLL
ncbi:MAG: hypothetical protein V1835_02310, partial [Candidatus Micrarchaeota archaeon]